MARSWDGGGEPQGPPSKPRKPRRDRCKWSRIAHRIGMGRAVDAYVRWRIA